jgi:hypothetical protein
MQRCPLSGQSGKHILAVSFFGFDPKLTLPEGTLFALDVHCA